MTPDLPDTVKHDIAALRAELDTLYRNHELPTARTQLPSATPRAQDRARIVVIGEVDAGKTSLINATIGRLDLLPTQSTRQFVAVGHGPPGQVHVHFADGHTDNMAANQLGGLLARYRVDGEAIDRIEVLLDDEFLSGLTLFDTPGVGGLDLHTTSATLSALDGATALVFVCSAGEKISIAERDFLVAATRRIDHVVFVQSKSDLADDGGAANLRENAETIKRRLSPEQYDGITFLAFSAVLAAEGAHGDTASLEESGVKQLRSSLKNIAANHSIYAQRNALREIKESISTAYHVLAQRRNAVQESTGPEAITAITARLSDIRRRRDSWRTLLARHIEEASFQATDEHEQHLQDLRTRYSDRLASVKSKEDMQTLTTDLVDDLRQWQLDTITSVHQQVADIATSLANGLVFVDVDELVTQLADPRKNAADCLAAASNSPRSAAESMTAVQSTYMGTMMGQNIARAISGTAVGMPYMIPLGIGWYLVQRYFRNRQEERAELTRRVREAISEASRLISSDTQRRYRRSSWAIVDAVDSAIDDALAGAEAEKKALTDATVDRRKELDRINRLDTSLRPLQDRWQSLHGSLTALPGPNAAAPKPCHSEIDTEDNREHHH